MRVLLRKHGMTLMGVKSNLYTAIGLCRILPQYCIRKTEYDHAGLDSKHASGIQSTVSSGQDVL